MQPSNQLKGLVEAYSHVGSEETAQLKMYEKTVVNTIGVYMVSEGYTENDVAEFLSTASEGKIGDKFFEALDSGVATQYITEEGKFDTNLRYVEGAIYERLGMGMLQKAGQGLLNFVKSIPRRVTGFGAKPKVTTNPTSGTTIIKATGNKRRIGTTAVGTGTVAAGIEDKDKEAIGRGIRRLSRAGGAAIEAGKKEYQKNSFDQEGDQIDEWKWPWDWGKDKDNKSKTKTEPATTTPPVNPRQILDRSREINQRRNDPLSPANKADREARLRASQDAAARAQQTQSRDSGGGRRTSDTAPATPPRSTASDVRPQQTPGNVAYDKLRGKNAAGRTGTTPEKRAAADASGMKQWAKLYGPGGKKELKSPTKAQKAIFKKYGMGEEVEMDESLRDTVDSLTKAGQRGLERLGVKINRVKRGTTTKADQEKRIQNNRNEDVELVTSFLVSEGFSDTVEGALAMLEGMSESWFNEILDVRLMEEAMLEYLQVMGEAESRDEALYIVSEMDEEAIDLLAIEVEDILEATPIPRTDVKYYKDLNKGKGGYAPVGGVPVPRASKKPDKKPTTQVAHYEPEGDEIKEKKVYTVTDLDKKGNTEAWKRYQQGNPQYKYGGLKGV